MNRERFYSCAEETREEDSMIKIRHDYISKNEKLNKIENSTVKGTTKTLNTKNPTIKKRKRKVSVETEQKDISDLEEENRSEEREKSAFKAKNIEHEENERKECEEQSPLHKKKKDEKLSLVKDRETFNNETVNKKEGNKKELNIEKGTGEHDEPTWVEEDIMVWDQLLKANKIYKTKECIDCGENYLIEPENEIKRSCIMCKENDHGCMQEITTNTTKLSKGLVWLCKECYNIMDNNDLNIIGKLKQGVYEKDKKTDKDYVREESTNNIEKGPIRSEYKEKGSVNNNFKPSKEFTVPVDDVILRYQSTTIRNSDLFALQEPNWISDPIISFWYEFTQKEMVGYDKGILLINPALSQVIKLADKSEMTKNLNAINAWQQEYLIVPINDNESDKQGGSHWSLLLYSRNLNEWYHFDTMNGFNTRHALKIAENLNQYLEFNESPKLVEISCTKQKDNFNCGAFLLCFTREALTRILKGRPLDSPCHYIDETDASYIRQQILEKITEKNYDLKNFIRKGNENKESHIESKIQEEIKNKNSNAKTSKKNDQGNLTENKKTCFYWVKGECGKRHDCYFAHPQLCPDIMSTGECRASRCSLYHPKMCRSIINHGYCSQGRKCYFTHPKLNLQRSNGNDHFREKPVEIQRGKASAYNHKGNFLERPFYRNWELQENSLLNLITELLTSRMAHANMPYNQSY